jgi:hypothetical protein
MPRGGHRDNAGRKSEWVSSSQTRPIRVPEWMADKVLDFARKLDNEEIIDSVQNQNSQGHEDKLAESLRSMLQEWSDRASGKETSPRWKNASTLIEEINELMKDF